jgi:NAD+ synthase
MQFTKESIKIDVIKETEKIVQNLKEAVINKFRKRGVVLGVSGGIDSSVVLALCVKAFGPKRVIAVQLPEADSSKDNFILTRQLVDKLGVETIIENMTPALAGFGCYTRRDEAIKKIFPEYDMSYKAKIILPQTDLERDGLNLFQLTIISPEGEEKTERLPIKEYLQIVAASNFKQRSRMCMLYYHAESRNFAVIGTPNKNEHALGFFVKHGDGGVDIRPIVHLFKSQVYQLAENLEIPEEIQSRTPTSDTYSAEQTQEEFFFKLPFDILDVIWYGWEQGVNVEDIAQAVKFKAAQVQFVINDLQRKISTTEYLRMHAL